MDLLSLPLIKRTRQNHALEHATMHLLSRANPALRLMAHSDWTGFTVYGEVDTQAVTRAVLEALARLKHRESWLAVHPRCGTNLAVSVMLASGVVYLTSVLPLRSRFVRLVAALVALLASTIVAYPLGMAVQRRVTLCMNLDGLHVKLVRREVRGSMVVHRVVVNREIQAEGYVLHPAR